MNVISSRKGKIIAGIAGIIVVAMVGLALMVWQRINEQSTPVGPCTHAFAQDPNSVYLSIMNSSYYMDFFVEESTVTLTGNGEVTSDRISGHYERQEGTISRYRLWKALADYDRAFEAEQRGETFKSKRFSRDNEIVFKAEIRCGDHERKFSDRTYLRDIAKYLKDEMTVQE